MPSGWSPFSKRPAPAFDVFEFTCELVVRNAAERTLNQRRVVALLRPIYASDPGQFDASPDISLIIDALRKVCATWFSFVLFLDIRDRL